MKVVRNLRYGARWSVVALAAVLLITPQNTIAGELQSIRDEVRDPVDRSFSPFSGIGKSSCSGSHRDRYEESDWGSDDSSDADNALFWLGAGAAYLVVTSPFTVPRSFLNDAGDPGYFTKYPYRKGESLLMYEPAMCDWSQQPRRYSGRIRMEYCENYQDLWRAGGQIQFETASRLGIDTEAHRFEENLGSGMTDHLWLGDCNFTYRFAQSEKAAFRAGLGFNWLDDPIRTDYGFNFTYGFDLYPRKPWVFSTEFDIGTLGKSDLFRVRTTAGVMIHRVEAYVGYEYLDVADTTFNGLITGLRVSF